MQYISGASDDLVELDGDISDEATARYSGVTPIEVTLASGDRVVAAIEYDRDRDGVWRFTLIDGEQHVELLPEYGEDNPHPGNLPKYVVGYSEVLFVPGEVIKVEVNGEVLTA